MAQKKGFSHITVSADDDDDVVIQAGIVEGEPLGGDPAACEAAGEVLEEVPAAPAEPSADGKDAEGREPAVPEQAARASGRRSDPSSQGPRAEDGYRETTLDDLESSKMSTTQKVVIVLALLGIAAFVAWYFLAR